MKNKKILSILLVCFLLFLQSSSYAMTSTELAEEFETKCPEIAQKLYDGGATKENIVSFIESTEAALENKNITLTEENFNSAMKDAITSALKYKENLPVYKALTQQFSKELIAFAAKNEFPQVLMPMYEFFKKYYLIEREKFTDIENFEWAKTAIEYLSSLGIISGYQDKTFGGNNYITRAEFTKIISQAFNLLPDDSTSFFDDISSGDWYCPYVNAAVDASIVTGFPDNTFRPNDFISRQDMAVIISRALNVSADDTSLPFNDMAEISDYAKSAISALFSSGVINGTGENMFSPEAFATRAQATQMIYNVIHHNV